MSALVGAPSPFSRNVKTTSRRLVSCSVRASANAPAGSPTNRVATLAVDRRGLLASAAALTAMSPCKPSLAIQGYTAGRIPGVTPDPELEGFNVYTRPEGKQGGHGVGWSEIPRYSFRVPAGWQEEPVSIADLGGTEIDLRFAGDEGSLEVVVAPVLRFRDVGFNADVRIEELGPPENIIEGFAPELFGNPIGNFDEDVSSVSVVKQQGLTFYKYEMAKPRSLVAATAFKNRVFILVVAANGRQWRKSQDKLRIVADSFKLPQTA